MRRILGFSLGRHWHCPNCKRRWYLYRHAYQHVYVERMPCLKR